jgi:hypothetical protein
MGMKQRSFASLVNVSLEELVPSRSLSLLKNSIVEL